MRKKGKLRSWNDQKGFGFIEANDGGKQTFLHISALQNCNRRPEIGQFVTYTMSTDRQGRSCAIKATLPGDRLPQEPKRSGVIGAFIVTSLFLAIVALSVAAGRVLAFILWTYLVASFVTFVFYALDKSAAKSGSWRTSESTLHWLSLVGGWPGALIAQQSLRHKSSKRSFRSVFWLTVILNCGAFIWLFTPTGSEAIQDWTVGSKQLFGPGSARTIEWAE